MSGGHAAVRILHRAVGPGATHLMFGDPHNDGANSGSCSPTRRGTFQSPTVFETTWWGLVDNDISR